MYAVGIDIGTTYTAAAVWRAGRAEIATLGSHAAAIPSVVFVRSDGSFLTGETASRRGLSEPNRVAREFKRRLGDTATILLGGAPYSAAALTARMLRSVLDAVSAREGGPPASICLAHPANWGPYKIDLLRQVVRLADVDQPVRFTTDPQAAASYYARQQQLGPGAVMAVYDLGGGTFDAAALRKTPDGFDLIGEPQGVERLGGIDFDAAIVDHVAASVGGVREQLDKDDPAAIAAAGRLRDECVQAKEALSADTDAAIQVLLPAISAEVRLTRSELEEMVRPAVRDSVEALRLAIRSAGYTPLGLDAVLLVGGSSRMPIVARMIGSELGREVAVDPNPKHAVALGAAWLASGAIAESGTASSPSSLAEPAELAVLAEPAALAKPAEVAARAKPAEPTKPTALAEPAKPAEAAALAEPAKPAEAAALVKPAKPAEAAALVKPAKPAEAAALAEPAKPAKVTKPAVRDAVAPASASVGSPADPTPWSEEPTGEIPLLAGSTGEIPVPAGSAGTTPGPAGSTPADPASGRPPLPKATVTARAAVGPAAGQATPPPLPLPPALPAPPAKTLTRRLPVLVAAAAAVLLLAVGGTAWALTRSGGRDGATAQVAPGRQPSQAPASSQPAAAAVPPDEQCTDAMKMSTRWVCLTKATLHDNTLTVWYTAEWHGVPPDIKKGFHLHIYGGDGTDPDESTMGSQAVQHSKYYFEDQEPSVRQTSDADFDAVGDAKKVCARIAHSGHGLEKAYDGSYHTGNCIPIQRS